MKSVSTMIGVVCLGVFLWLIVPFYVLCRVNGVNPSPQASASGFANGDTATIVGPTGHPWIADSYEHWQQTRKLADAKDWPGLAQMESEGSILSIPNGHKVRVINRGWLCSEVRFLEQRLNGQTVFVDTGFLAQK